MTVLLVLLPRPRRDAQRPRALLCVQEECFLGGSVMSRALDLNRDPCEDFYAYVCGSWKPTAHGTRSALDDIRLRTLSRAALLLDQQYGKDFIGHAAKLYRSCVEAIRGNQDHTMKLRAFLQERGLFWPRPAPADVTTDPLLVLVDLSLNWRLDLWFHVALVATPGSNSVHVRLQPGVVNQDWARFLWMLRHESQMMYLAYQQEASKLFTKDGFETMTRDVMEQLASLELQVAQQLSAGNMTLQPPRGPRDGRKPCDRVTWRHADCLTPGVKPSRWLAVLSSHVGASVNENTTVSVWNPRFGESLGKILSLNPINLLLDVIGWTVVQMLGWAAHPLLAYVRLGGEVDTRHSTPPFCLAATEALLGEAATATLLATHLPERYRRQVNGILDSVAKSFSQMMRASTSALSLSHDGDVDPTHNVTLSLWPKTASRLQLERSYGPMPAPPSSSSFLDNWLTLAPAVASLAKTAALAGGSPMGPFGFRPFAWHHRYENGDAAVVLPLWIMFPPIYGPGLPPGMIFGGAGSLYATLLAEGLPTALLDSLDKRSHYASAQCSHKQDPWLRRAIGIEAAWRALRRAPSVETSGSGGHLLGLEDFSSAHLFFLAACLQLCDAPLSRRAECNFALRQSDAFASVFACAEGSNMNPKDKCRAW
ncbi:neprilysin-1-like [Dermacentor andersoni]|uniref:neprilysin-1-like n=1 Tax=Dermacentor andersoni TaxID=34620 RepID=UPI003B3A2F93